jgi:hypothetical protein
MRTRVLIASATSQRALKRWDVAKSEYRARAIIIGRCIKHEMLRSWSLLRCRVSNTLLRCLDASDMSQESILLISQDERKGANDSDHATRVVHKEQRRLDNFLPVFPSPILLPKKTTKVTATCYQGTHLESEGMLLGIAHVLHVQRIRG